jgi:hypothetical protein
MPDNNRLEQPYPGPLSDAGLHIWDYLAYGPWPDEDSFALNMRQQSANFETILSEMMQKRTPSQRGAGN